MPSAKEIAAALSNIPYFTDIDRASLEVVAQNTSLRKYEAGQIVFLEGEQNVGLCVVREGWLKVVKTSADGRELVLDYINVGGVFNTVGVFIEIPNPATVIALESTTVWIIQQETILQLLDQHPKMARVIIQHLAERVHNLIKAVEDLSLRTVEARLARHLLQQSSTESLQRPRWATQAEIANRLGTVPDVLHRAMRNLAKENLIRVERDQIQILDRTGLEARAELDK